jgi:GNAT superfamily N-acetyltransferase
MNTRVEHLTKERIEFYKPHLDRLSKQASDPSFRFVPQHKIFVVFVGEEIVAYAVANNPYGYWVFRNCVVDRKYRGNGFQRLLIEARIDYIKERGGDKVSVGIDPKNTKSLNNMLSYGFKFAKGGMKHNDHWYLKLYKTL